MDRNRVMAQLAEACAALEAMGDHAAAAYVEQAMVLVGGRHDRAQADEPPCGQPG